MRPRSVEGPAIALDVELGIEQREEPVLIEAFVAKPAVEALDMRILNGFPRLDELEGDAAIGGPRIEGPAAEL